MKRLAMVLAVVGLMASWAGSASAFPVTFAPLDYDNTANTVIAGPEPVNNQTSGLFRDVFWWGINNGQPAVGSPDFINRGNSLILENNHAVPGPGPIQALNFTGPSVSGGQSYLSIYDTTPGDGSATRNLFNATGGLTVSADVLFVKHNVSAGVVALYNEGQAALALLASNGDGNNPDIPKVNLVFQSPGQGVQLTSASVPSGSFCTATDGGVGCTPGDHWYRVVMDLTVTGDAFTVVGRFYNHSTPADPTSGLGSLITTLTFTGLLNPENIPVLANRVLTNPGEIGLIAMGNESISLPDNVGVSITNFDGGTPVPEPVTMFLGGTGLILLGYAARRRLFGQ